MLTPQNIRLTGLECLLYCLDRVARWRGRQANLPAHLKTGLAGEQAAYFYLRKLDFVVVARRWNDGPLPGDIDLIAWDKDVLCFIEVKTRTSTRVATASAAVDRNKRKILRRLARHYLACLPESEDSAQVDGKPQTRFDIVTVYDLPGENRKIQLIPWAFGWSERSGRD